MVRRIFLLAVFFIVAAHYLIALYYPLIWWGMIFWGPVILVGFIDMFQTKKAVLRNFPIIGNLRYLFEAVRPEINQYFVESNSSGRPFSREERSLVYQRAKNARDTLPFGTQKDFYEIGYEWTNHSVTPIKVDSKNLRIKVGGPQCKFPYNASVFNIGAMSYGALSKNAIQALNEGAKIGNFAHNTGEGGISPYHLRGGDLIWQIGTGYFGCRTDQGRFCASRYKDRSQIDYIKMIELKISQGAKPGGGGIVPGVKVSKEIAEIRGVPQGKTIISPAAHLEFDTPNGLLEFVAKLRELSGGKPVGFKLCVGRRREFFAICKAMVKTGILPDFISVDGAEGGTGAAPLEFSNYLGCPLTEGLIFVHNALVGFNLRDDIKVFASGKVISGFGMVHRLAIGADAIYSARGMMMALGCIQAVKCNSNKCPVGVATQDPGLVVGLVVADKNKRVANYHNNTVESLAHLLGAMGIEHPEQLQPWHIMRRVDKTSIKNYNEIYGFLKKGDLLKEPYPPYYERAIKMSSADKFMAV